MKLRKLYKWFILNDKNVYDSSGNLLETIKSLEEPNKKSTNCYYLMDHLNPMSGFPSEESAIEALDEFVKTYPYHEEFILQTIYMKEQS